MKKIVFTVLTLTFISTASAQWPATPAPRLIQEIFTAANVDSTVFASEWEENITWSYDRMDFPVDLIMKNNLSPSDSVIYDINQKRYFTSDSIQAVKARDKYSWAETVEEAQDSSLLYAVGIIYSAPSVLSDNYIDSEGGLSLRSAFKLFPELRAKTIEWLTPMFVYNFQRQDKFRKDLSLKVLAEARKYIDSLTPAKIECEKNYLASERAQQHWKFRRNPPNATCDGPDREADNTFRYMQAFIFRRVVNDGIPVAELKTALTNLKNKLVSPVAKK